MPFLVWLSQFSTLVRYSSVPDACSSVDLAVPPWAQNLRMGWPALTDAVLFDCQRPRDFARHYISSKTFKTSVEGFLFVFFKWLAVIFVCQENFFISKEIINISKCFFPILYDEYSKSYIYPLLVQQLSAMKMRGRKITWCRFHSVGIFQTRHQWRLILQAWAITCPFKKDLSLRGQGLAQLCFAVRQVRPKCDIQT